MDGTSLSSQFPVTPRLRVPRQTYLSSGATRSALDGDTDDTNDHTDDDEDNASTPRIASLNVAPDDLDVVRSASATPVVEDNPASRLRALLSRVPRDDTPLASAQARRSPSLHASDMDMDIDIPQFSPPFKSTPQSNASTTLKDLFSRALREPGESPSKPQRRRRSSLDSSGIEETPIESRGKSKRLSLSDDEKEKANRSTDVGVTSERSFMSSQAATFDALRQRLSGHKLGSGKSDSRSGPPPVATSTSLRQSVSQFPSQISGPNLLNDDSDMRILIEGVDSDAPTDDEHAIGGNGKTPTAGPSNHLPRPQSPFVRQRTLSRHGSAESARHLHSRPSSSLSNASHSDVDPEQEHIHELERGWNRPLSAYMNKMDLSANGLSPGRSPPALRRHGSSASLASSDDLAHSTGSQGSDRHYHRNSSRNGHLSQGSVDSAHSRASSISPIQLRVSDRSRTLSQPTAPNGLQVRLRTDSKTVAERPSSSLAHSRPSFSSHSHRVPDRAVSPTSSVTSQDPVQEKKWDVQQHVRERNWNAPRPKWSLEEEQAKLVRRRSQVISPVSSPASRHRHDSAASQSGRQVVAKPSSPTEARIPRNSSTANNLSRPTLKRSPSTSSLAGRDSGILRVRPHSSLALSQPSHRLETSKTSPSSSHGINSNLSHRRAPSSPTPAIHSKGANGSVQTHIPVRVKERHLNGTKRTEALQREVERDDGPYDVPPKISVAIEPMEMHDSDFSFHEEDILASSSRPRLSTGSGEAKPDMSDDEFSPPLNGTLHTPDDSHVPLLPTNFSPPPSPPISPSDQIMSTPKRRPSLTSSGLDFKSPSTPKGLPELPDPPSSETESDHTAPLRTPAGIRNVDTKTPRPPGGWATPFATPAPSQRVDLVQSKPELGIFQSDLNTPPASLSKAASLTLKTPAPPGAWLPTPANSKRLQKVRFDEEEASHGQVDESTSPEQSGRPASIGSSSQMLEKDASTFGPERVESSSPRTPRRTSSIRVVDAYGKQIVDTPSEQQSNTDIEVSQRDVDPERPDVPVGTKTRIRILDSMSKPAEGPSTLDPTEDNPAQENLSSFMEELEGKKLERKQALELLQKTIADLKNDFTRTDIETESPDPAGTRATDLLARSQRARNERERLRREISLATKVQHQVTTNDKPDNTSRPIYRSHGLLFWTLVIIAQFCIFLALCRWSSLRARRLFLTTYMDPFYPELHLHVTNPDLLRVTTASSRHTSTYDTHKYTGWMQSINTLWRHLSDSLNALQDILWETSGDPPRTIPKLPT